MSGSRVHSQIFARFQSTQPDHVVNGNLVPSVNSARTAVMPGKITQHTTPENVTVVQSHSDHSKNYPVGTIEKGGERRAESGRDKGEISTVSRHGR